jgi:hypothetical protein
VLVHLHHHHRGRDATPAPLSSLGSRLRHRQARMAPSLGGVDVLHHSVPALPVPGTGSRDRMSGEGSSSRSALTPLGGWTLADLGYFIDAVLCTSAMMPIRKVYRPASVTVPPPGASLTSLSRKTLNEGAVMLPSSPSPRPAPIYRPSRGGESASAPGPSTDWSRDHDCSEVASAAWYAPERRPSALALVG